MTHVCPCCGTKLQSPPDALPLTATEMEILNYVASKKGTRVFMDDIIMHVYQLRDEPEDPENVIRQLVYRINRKIGPTIEGIRGRGQGGGYRLRAQ